MALYLSEGEVRTTIRKIRSKAAAGSVVLADIYVDRMFKRFKSGSGTEALKYTDEKIKFDLNLSTNYEEEVAKFIRNETLSVGEVFFVGWKDARGSLLAEGEMKMPTSPLLTLFFTSQKGQFMGNRS